MKKVCSLFQQFSLGLGVLAVFSASFAGLFYGGTVSAAVSSGCYTLNTATGTKVFEKQPDGDCMNAVDPISHKKINSAKECAVKEYVPGATWTPTYQKYDCKTIDYTATAPEAGGNTTIMGCSGADCGLFDKYINPLIKFMSVLVGIMAVISIVIAGIMYSSAAGEPQKAAAARKRILMTIVGLVAYLLLYGLLNFLVPGGL